MNRARDTVIASHCPAQGSRDLFTSMQIGARSRRSISKRTRPTNFWASATGKT